MTERKEIVIKLVGWSQLLWLLIAMTTFAFGFACGSAIAWLEMMDWMSPAYSI